MSNLIHRYSIYLVLVAALGLSAASFFLPVPADTLHETASRWRMVSTVAMVTLIGGAALLFLQGLSAFKSDLRVAYRWFAVGMILLAVALLQWPFLVLLDAESSFWVLSGAVVVPFIVSTAFMYRGMRQFGNLLQIRSWLLSWPIALSIVTGVALLSGAAAYIFLTTIGPPAVSDDTYLYTATVAWSAGFGILTWLIAIKVYGAIGVSYQTPMGWLVVALGALCFSAVHEYITSYFISPQDWYLYSGAISWPFIISGFLFVIAGSMFTAERTGVSQTRTPDGEINLGRSYIDSITNIANLASRPKDIDPILDGLRRVTANLQPDTSLSTDDRIQLLDTYKQLEEYLVTSDPLKSFTKEQLRTLLYPEFRTQVETLL